MSFVVFCWFVKFFWLLKVCNEWLSINFEFGMICVCNFGEFKICCRCVWVCDVLSVLYEVLIIMMGLFMKGWIWNDNYLRVFSNVVGVEWLYFGVLIIILLVCLILFVIVCVCVGILWFLGLLKIGRFLIFINLIFVWFV